MKALTFHVAFVYRTLAIDGVIRIANAIYNEKGHSSLAQNSPRAVHFDKFLSCKMARLSFFEYQKHHFDSMAMQARIPIQQTLTVGQKVKILLQRSIFRKHRPLQDSIWSEKIFRITSIDESKYPPVYTLDKHHKKFYDFELQGLPELFPVDEPDREKNTILIDSFQLPQRAYLRSGKSRPDSNEPIYSIMVKGKISTATEKDLRDYKKLLGSNSLKYSSFFSNEENSKYIV